jgi:catechol 2,3-dioxygenase-like lactoylglutathione lyase family enzyme
LALPVYDAAATYQFYTQVMDFPLLEAFSGDDWGGKPWLMMIFSTGDGRQIALCALRGAKRPDDGDLPRDVRHFAFAVASNRELDAWKRKLSAHKIEFWEEDHGPQRSVYFADPNGVILEVTTPASSTAIALNPRASDIVQKWIKGDHG